MPDPAVRSTTVRDARTSPGPASAEISARYVNRQASYVTIPKFDLPGMQACTHRNAMLIQRITNGRGTPHRTCGSVERCEASVAELLYDPSSEMPNNAINGSVMVIENRPPPFVPKGDQLPRRVHDVCEENRCKRPIIVFGCDIGFSEEAGDLGDHWIDIAKEQIGFATSKFNEAAVRDARCGSSAQLDVIHRVTLAMKHKCGCAHEF